ncbi:condensation domain-containing protein, partial [Streptomyces sparsus]
LPDTAGDAPRRPALVRAERPDPVPLSFTQRSIWFLNQLDTAAATYNIPLVVPLEQQVDEQALRAALADVTDRHESLRTLLPAVDGVPRQDVRAPGTVRPELRVVDCPPQEVSAHVAAASRRPFDLTRDLPLWAGLYGPPAGPRTLVLVAHHSAVDGWSLRPLADDLSTAYAARYAGRPPRWAELPVQYVDYTLWQHALLAPDGRDGDEDEGPDGGQAGDQDGDREDGLFGRQLSFWKQALAGLPEESVLPFARPRPSAAGRSGGGLAVEVDAAHHRALLGLAEEGGASLFMVLQSAVAALLTRCGAGTDIAVGTPVAGRGDDALDDLVGLMANSLVLRTDTSGDPHFRELLARVRDFDLAAFDHQDLPFDLLVEETNPVRVPGRHPLFQVMLALQNNSEAELRLGGNRAALRPTATGTAKFDLFFDVVEHRTADGAPDGLRCHVEYSTDLFDADTAQRLAAGLRTLLGAAATDPDLPLGSLPAPELPAPDTAA